MVDPLIEGIVRQCLDMDALAEEQYGSFADCESRPEVAAFWRKMEQEENRHLACWRRLLMLVERGAVPPLLASPHRVFEEIRDGRARLEALLADAEGARRNPFRIACLLECCLLHPALGLMLDFSRKGLESSDKGDYAAHLAHFLDGVRRFGDLGPEMELLGNTLERLWKESQVRARQGLIDPLTGLYNRRGLNEAMRAVGGLAQRNGSSVGVLMADIDDFKAINDTYGHPAGDAVLRAVAEEFRQGFRASDVVGRYGGEEFVALLSPTEPRALHETAEKIRRRIARNVQTPCAVTVSVGAAHSRLSPAFMDELHALITEADQALLKAKRNGKNRVALAGARAA